MDLEKDILTDFSLDLKKECDLGKNEQISFFFFQPQLVSFDKEKKR